MKKLMMAAFLLAGLFSAQAVLPCMKVQAAVSVSHLTLCTDAGCTNMGGILPVPGIGTLCNDTNPVTSAYISATCTYTGAHACVYGGVKIGQIMYGYPDYPPGGCHQLTPPSNSIDLIMPGNAWYARWYIIGYCDCNTGAYSVAACLVDYATCDIPQ